MADATKYVPISSGTMIADLRSHFSLMKTRKTMVFSYGFIFVFVAVTGFLAFNPSTSSPSSPLFTSIFSLGLTNESTVSVSPTSSNYRSQFSSFFYLFFLNSSSSSSSPLPSSQQQNHNQQQRPQPSAGRSDNSMSPSSKMKKETASEKNQTNVGGLKPNQSTSYAPRSPVLDSKKNRGSGEILNRNQSAIRFGKSSATPNSSFSSNVVSPEKKNSGKEAQNVAEKGGLSNLSSSLSKKKGNGTKTGAKEKQGKSDNRIESLLKCNLFDGNWVKDESYPLYKPGSCSLIDEQFNCLSNGRPDQDYQKLKWKPKGCSLPRLNPKKMLEFLRGKRLVFVGDSLNRNMWESLVCTLKTAVKNQDNVYEASGRQQFRTEASYSFIFKDYNCTVEFVVSPFLVQEWEMPEKNGTKKETLRLDLITRSSDSYRTADIIIFNTGHWWTHEKTSRGKDYYQEGNHVYGELNVIEAFHRALNTWAKWVDHNINPDKSFVFFRGYSSSHFSGGQWNAGGQCDDETEPIKNDAYLTAYPPKMSVLESVLGSMRTPVTYLNITRLTDYRKDGHPSIYRKRNLPEAKRRSPLRFQDCSHWCLPGVPDAWNELLYAELMVKQYQKQKKHR